MKVKLIISILLLIGASGGAFYYYQYNYIKTLMLSEIIGKTDNNLTNIALNLFDFDTGLTRNDVNHLKNNKDYWIARIKEVEAINDPDHKAKANTQLLSDMMDDPTLKKIAKIITSIGLGVASNLLETISS